MCTTQAKRTHLEGIPFLQDALPLLVIGRVDMICEHVLGHTKPMAEDSKQEKKTRRKRRVVGTEKPPRKAFSLRLEEATFDRMNLMLRAYSGSRNDYIERLIEFDLQYRERLRPLNTPVPPPENSEDD